MVLKKENFTDLNDSVIIDRDPGKKAMLRNEGRWCRVEDLNEKDKYTKLEKIGSGSFGSIYKGENIRTKELVAIKVEPIINNTKLLKNESTIYQYLGSKQGIPNVKWFGKDDHNFYMVIKNNLVIYIN